MNLIDNFYELKKSLIEHNLLNAKKFMCSKNINRIPLLKGFDLQLIGNP